MAAKPDGESQARSYYSKHKKKSSPSNTSELPGPNQHAPCSFQFRCLNLACMNHPRVNLYPDLMCKLFICQHVKEASPGMRSWPVTPSMSDPVSAALQGEKGFQNILPRIPIVIWLYPTVMFPRHCPSCRASQGWLFQASQFIPHSSNLHLLGCSKKPKHPCYISCS